MASRVISWGGMIASVVWIISAQGTCRAQQAKPTIEQILRVWKERQDKVSTARFELECEETLHKGSTSLLTADRRKKIGLPPETEPNPPRDYLVKGTSGLSLDGPKLRYSYEQPQWDPIGKQLYQQSYLDVFDGKLYKFLEKPSSGQVDHPEAAIRKVERSESALKYPMLPLIYAVRGNHSQFFQKLGNFQVSGQSANIDGRSCVELIQSSGHRNKREVFYLDQERNYVVVRQLILSGDMPMWQLNINYRPDSEIGWIPQSWEYVIRIGKGDIINSGRYKVAHYNINPPLDANEFDISFPPGTCVHDESSGHYVKYVIREDGDRGRAVPANLNPTYESLQKAGARINRRVMPRIWASIFVLALGGLIWLWSRRRKRDPRRS